MAPRHCALYLSWVWVLTFVCLRVGGCWMGKHPVPGCGTGVSSSWPRVFFFFLIRCSLHNILYCPAASHAGGRTTTSIPLLPLRLRSLSLVGPFGGGFQLPCSFVWAVFLCIASTTPEVLGSRLPTLLDPPRAMHAQCRYICKNVRK